jgi:hypothetical protein
MRVLVHLLHALCDEHRLCVIRSNRSKAGESTIDVGEHGSLEAKALAKAQHETLEGTDLGVRALPFDRELSLDVDLPEG